MGRPREHDAHTRVALLAAAEELIAKGGFDAVSVRAVAGQAGTSTRAVYSVLGSKHGLIRALAQRAFELLAEQVAAVPLTSDPVADLRSAAIDGFRRFVLDHPDLFRLAFVWSPVELGRDTADASSRALVGLTSRIERAQTVGALPERPVIELALEIHAICQGLAALELCGLLPGANEERIWTEAVGDLLTGLAARAVSDTSTVGTRRS